MNSEFTPPSEAETTGRFIVTFREEASTEAIATLENRAGIRSADLLRSGDFAESGIDMDQVPAEGGAVLGNLGMAVVNVPPDAAGMLAMEAGEDSAILSVEPEGVVYALSELRAFSLDYMRGFRDCAQSLYTSAATTPPGGEEYADLIEAAGFIDSPSHTWGLIATRSAISRLTGQGIKVAVLDTGLFLAHPDFIGRSVVSRSFIPGVVSANDGHGHGTHCTGTACGALKPAVGPRYGIAHKANIFIAKVLSDQGSGVDGGILAGIDWAIANKCHVISMSLGANVPTTTSFYETAGQRQPLRWQLWLRRSPGQQQDLHGRRGVGRQPADGKLFGPRHGARRRLGRRHCGSGRRCLFLLADANPLPGHQRDQYGDAPCRRDRCPLGASHRCPRRCPVAEVDRQLPRAVAADCRCRPWPGPGPVAFVFNFQYTENQ